MPAVDFSKFEADKEAKRQIVKTTIIEKCNTSPELADKHETIRVVRDAIGKHGPEFLHIDILSDGKTNFGYKIYLENDKLTLKYAMFGKLAFPFAMWNPDPTVKYNIQRLHNELIMMETFEEIYPGCVPTPLFDVKIDDMMLLVVGWSNYNDVPHHEQLRQGKMDHRLAPKLGISLAKLHSITEFDPNFNNDAREPIVAFNPIHKQVLEGIVDNTTSDNSRVAIGLRNIGKEDINKALEVLRQHQVDIRQCLVHSDYHSYNLLTEKKTPSGEFGPDGSFILIDWEMAHVGVPGRDLGLFQAFPLLFPLAHAINGNYEPIQDSLTFLDTMWDAYVKELRACGTRDEEFILFAARSTLAWCGWYCFMGIYNYRIHFDVFPIDYDKDGEFFRDCLGNICYQYFFLGFGGDDTALASVEEYRTKMKDIYLAEMEYVKQHRPKKTTSS